MHRNMGEWEKKKTRANFKTDALSSTSFPFHLFVDGLLECKKLHEYKDLLFVLHFRIFRV